MLHSPQILLSSRGAAAAPALSPTWTATGNPAAQNITATSITFSGVAIGSPAASDVIVAIYSSTGPNATGMTCNGVAMTFQSSEQTIISGLEIYSITASAAGVTGLGTTTFVASAASNQGGDEVIQVGKLTGVNPTPTGTGSANTGTSIGVTVPATGIAIVGAVATATTALTWLGGIEDFSTTTATGQGVHIVHATATGTVSETPVGSGSIHFAYAAWGP